MLINKQFKTIRDMYSLKNIFNQRGSNSKPERKISLRNFRIPLIGEQAPSFTAESTTGTINFPADFGNNWKIILKSPDGLYPGLFY